MDIPLNLATTDSKAIALLGMLPVSALSRSDNETPDLEEGE